MKDGSVKMLHRITLGKHDGVEHLIDDPGAEESKRDSCHVGSRIGCHPRRDPSQPRAIEPVRVAI